MPIDFETLFSHSPNSYVILDSDLKLVWMNEAYLRATMRSREDIIGRTMFDAFPSEPGTESHDLLAASFEQVLRTGETDEIALIRYDIANRDGSMDQRYWSATHTPLRGDDGEVRYILQHTVDVTELETLRRLRDEVGVVRRASAVQARNRDLAAESRRLIDLFEQAPGFVAALTGPEHRFSMTNQAYRALVGRENLLGKSVQEALPEVVEQGFIELLDKVCTSGEPFVGRRIPISLGSDAFARAKTRYLTFIFQPVFDDADSVSGIIIQGYDVSEEVEYEERQDLLIDELNHRVKNTLAIVQGLAAQSFGQVAEARAAKAVFDARLKALSAAHTLLTEEHWGTARLDDILRRSAEATAGLMPDRLAYDGPDLSLRPQAAVSLAMIVHELCTNAIKHGALSRDTGHVSIAWGRSGGGDDERLWISWTERGGPEVEAPARGGFGTRLISRGLSTGSGSKVQMNFPREGLECRIETPLAEATT